MITVELLWEGPAQKFFLNLESDEENVIWAGQVELLRIGSVDQWVFRSGRMSDGKWLREVKYAFSPILPWEEGDWMRTISVAGVQDNDLDGVADAGESISYQTIRAEIYEMITPFEGVGPEVRRLLRQKDAPGTADERITAYTYVGNEPGSRGKIQTSTTPTGMVTTRTYYGQDSTEARRARGRLLKIEQSLPIAFNTDALTDYHAGASEIIHFEWGTVETPGFFDHELTLKTIELNSASNQREIFSQEYIPYLIQQPGSQDDIRQFTTRTRIDGSSPARYHETVVQIRDYEATLAPGRIRGQRDPDTKLGSFFTYTYGSYDSATDSFHTAGPQKDELMVIETSGQVTHTTYGDFSSVLPRKGYSRKTMSYETQDGRLLRRKDFVYVQGESSGGVLTWKLVEDVRLVYDTRKRLNSVVNVLTGETLTQQWVGGRLRQRTDMDGIVVGNEYDALGRRVRITEEALASVNLGSGQNAVNQGQMFTEIIHDPRGNQRKIRTKGTPAQGSSQVLTETRTYNLADEPTGITLACESSQQIARTLSTVSGEGWIITETGNNGTQKVTTYLDDGRIKKIIPASGPTAFYHYGVGSDGTRVTLVRYGADDGNAPYKLTEYDWLGNVVKTKVPALDDTSSPGTVTDRITAYTYDTHGRVTMTARTGLPTTRFVYGIPGDDEFTVREWSDLDGDGEFDSTIEPAGEVYWKNRLINGVAWKTTVQYAYARSGSSERAIVGEERERLSDLSSTLLSESRVIDNEGHATVVTMSADGLKRIEEIRIPTGETTTADHKKIYLHRRLYREEDPLNRVATYRYDELGRRVESTNFENISHLTVYQNNCNRIDYEQAGSEAHQIGYKWYGGTAAVGARNQPEYRFVLASGHAGYGQSSSSINPAGLNPASNDKVISVERFTYDSAGRQQDVYSAGALRTRITYDTFGCYVPH